MNPLSLIATDSIEIPVTLVDRLDHPDASSPPSPVGDDDENDAWEGSIPNRTVSGGGSSSGPASGSTS